MSPLPRRMLGRAASWENPQVRPSFLPERRLTYVGVAVAIRFFVGFPHQILISPSGASKRLSLYSVMSFLTSRIDVTSEVSSCAPAHFFSKSISV